MEMKKSDNTLAPDTKTKPVCKEVAAASKPPTVRIVFDSTALTVHGAHGIGCRN